MGDWRRETTGDDARGSGLEFPQTAVLQRNPLRRWRLTFLKHSSRRRKGVSATPGTGHCTKAGVFVWPGPTPNHLTLGVLPLVGSTGDTGESGDIEILVVAAGLGLLEREGEGLCLGDGREDQLEEHSHSRER